MAQLAWLTSETLAEEQLDGYRMVRKSEEERYQQELLRILEENSIDR